jgi:lipopolysaccharide/colanic/teichoic acid biosynthesis glycosyltransferase
MPEPASITLLTTGCIGLAVRFLQRRYREAKPYVDWAVSLALLVLTGPLMLVCAALVKLTSRGPAFYTQERVGLHGRIFRIIKLRTMRRDAEVDTGPVWANGQEDPRVTPIGTFLRRTHLDEFPQLINVLKGDMSLVGPRPERPCFVEELKAKVPGYERRLAVKPGITGMAQILAGYDQTIRDVRLKVYLDCTYMRRMCWWVDVRIIAGTISRVLFQRRERRAAKSRESVTNAYVVK